MRLRRKRRGEKRTKQKERKRGKKEKKTVKESRGDPNWGGDRVNEETKEKRTSENGLLQYNEFPQKFV